MPKQRTILLTISTHTHTPHHLLQLKQNPLPAMAAAASQEEPTWPELLGSNNWVGLIDPLHLSLRRLILHCGDLCQATYDAFNNDTNSKFCGTSRYGKTSFFDKVMFKPSIAATTAADFFVSSFLYATARVDVPQAFLLHSRSRDSWDRESNWIGYVAVTADAATRVSGHRDIYIAWRGTTRDYEWVDVLDADLVSIKPLLNSNRSNSGRNNDGGSSSSDSDSGDDAKVMKGWLTIYDSDDPKSSFTKLSAKMQLRQIIEQLVGKYKGEKISIILTGHSLGASLSVVSAFDLVENVVSSEILVSAIIFGSPQIGNRAFEKRVKGFSNLKILHIKNTIDLITHYPGRLMGYRNTGIDLVIDTRKSTRLKESTNPGDWHNLQAMLHIVAGWNGAEGEFDETKVKRSIALVNKSCGFLKEELLVPEVWWVEKNRGMVLGEDGDWTMGEPDDEDIPEPEF